MYGSSNEIDMNSLQDLQTALVTAIVRYARRKKTLQQADAETDVVFQLSRASDLIPQLSKIIDLSTEQTRTRRPLFNYILSHIKLIKFFLDNQVPFPEQYASEFAKRLIQFMLDIQKLLSTSQTVQIKVSSCDEKLFGFCRGILALNAYCDSGAILNDLLFSSPKWALHSPAEIIESHLTRMVHDHQTSMTINTLLSENQYLRAKLEELKQDNHELRRQKKDREFIPTPTRTASRSHASAFVPFLDEPVSSRHTLFKPCVIHRVGLQMFSEVSDTSQHTSVKRG